MATTAAAGAFIGSFFTSYIPLALLLIIIGLIVSYESFALLNASRIKKKRHNNINNELDEIANGDRILNLSKNRLILLESIIGFGIGFLGGLVGSVLGSIRMPAMMSVLKMELMVMGCAAKIGGYFGARYTNRFSDTSLKRIIGIVLIVVAITMFLTVFQITTHIPTGL